MTKNLSTRLKLFQDEALIFTNVHMTKNLSTRLKREKSDNIPSSYGGVHMTKNLSTRLKPLSSVLCVSQ